jgi:hypothetical protein
MTNKIDFPWRSRNGVTEARLVVETVEDVTYYFRNVGSSSRGVAKTMTKDAFERTYTLGAAA